MENIFPQILKLLLPCFLFKDKWEHCATNKMPKKSKIDPISTKNFKLYSENIYKEKKRISMIYSLIHLSNNKHEVKIFKF